MNASFKRFERCDRGASLIEYTLLIGLVSIAIVISIGSIAGNLGTIWSTLAVIVGQAAAA